MSGFSSEELAALEDAGLVEAVLNVVLASGAGLEEDLLVKILEESPEGFGIVHSVWLLNAEIENGGFHQYFWNHKQSYVALVRRSLGRIGAGEHLAAFEEAVVVLNRAPVQAVPGRPEAVLEDFSESAMSSAMSHLDDRWYSLPELDSLLVSFIRANPLSVWEED